MTAARTLPAMPPKPTGTIEEYAHADGRTITYRARVRANGTRHRVILGTNHEGWNRQAADNELERIQQQITRGVWTPPETAAAKRAKAAAAPAVDESFHVYASRWWRDKRLELAPKGRVDYEWRLKHLLRHLHATPVADFTVPVIDRYRAAVIRERAALEEAHAASAGRRPLTRAQRDLLGRLANEATPMRGQDRRTARALAALGLANVDQTGHAVLTAEGKREQQIPPRPTRKPMGNRAINMTLDLLAQILDAAVDDGLLDSNPARGKKRRLKPAPRAKGVLEPDMVIDLLDAAREWEQAADARGRYGARALLATLCLAGPRVTEATDALRSRLDIHGGRLELGKKTEAGTDRQVELTAFLLGELRAHLAATPAELRDLPGLPVFPSGRGGRLNDSNVRNRLLADILPVVNARREAAGRMLLPTVVTPHTFRRTFATLALAAGRDPRFVMGQLGHTDARFTLSVYAQVLQRQRVDYDLVWALMRFAGERESWGPAGTLGTVNEWPGGAANAPGPATKE